MKISKTPVKTNKDDQTRKSIDRDDQTKWKPQLNWKTLATIEA